MFQGIFFLHSLRAVLFSETSAGGARAANGLGGGGGRHGAALATIALAPTLQKIRDLGVIHTFEVRVEPRKTLAHARTWQLGLTQISGNSFGNKPVFGHSHFRKFPGK